ncbi:MAG: DUF6504 family protein [Armatimonadota bacterium]
MIFSSDRRLVGFTWRSRRVVLDAVLDCWEEAGQWWIGEHPRRCYRVKARGGRVYELEEDLSAGAWRVTRILD